jgi:hypothetical protein
METHLAEGQSGKEREPVRVRYFPVDDRAAMRLGGQIKQAEAKDEVTMDPDAVRDAFHQIDPYESLMRTQYFSHGPITTLYFSDTNPNRPVITGPVPDEMMGKETIDLRVVTRAGVIELKDIPIGIVKAGEKASTVQAFKNWFTSALAKFVPGSQAKNDAEIDRLFNPDQEK